MLRNPIDMMYSMWSQFRYSGNEQIEDFEEALAAEMDRRAGRRIRRAAHCVTGLYYHEMARFSEQVRRYFDIFGRENVKVVIFDDFKADTAAVYRDVLEFLDIDAGFETSFDIVNPNKEVRLEWLQRMIVSGGFSLMLLKGPLDLPGDDPFADAIFLSDAGRAGGHRRLHQIRTALAFDRRAAGEAGAGIPRRNRQTERLARARSFALVSGSWPIKSPQQRRGRSKHARRKGRRTAAVGMALPQRRDHRHPALFCCQ